MAPGFNIMNSTSCLSASSAIISYLCLMTRQHVLHRRSTAFES